MKRWLQVILAVITVSYTYGWEDNKKCRDEVIYDEYRETNFTKKNCSHEKHIVKKFSSKSEARNFLNNVPCSGLTVFGYDLKETNHRHFYQINCNDYDDYFYDFKIKQDGVTIWEESHD